MGHLKVPRSLQDRVLQVNQAIEQLSGRLGRSPTAHDIAEHTGLPIGEVAEALEAGSAYCPTKLGAPRPNEENDADTLDEMLGSEDPGYQLVELDQALGPAFSALPTREQTILKLRFVDDLMQREIGERMGISQMHVSRLLRRALDRLDPAAAQYAQPQA